MPEEEEEGRGQSIQELGLVRVGRESEKSLPPSLSHTSTVRPTDWWRLPVGMGRESEEEERIGG